MHPIESAPVSNENRKAMLPPVLGLCRQPAITGSMPPESTDGAHGWIEAKVLPGFGNFHEAVVLGDVVDARLAAIDRKHRGTGGRLHMHHTAPLRLQCPGAGTVEAAIPQDDAVHARRARHGGLEFDHAFERAPLRTG